MVGRTRYVICQPFQTLLFKDTAYAPTDRTTEQLLAKYFGVDLAQAEREKRAILQEIAAQRLANERN